MADFTEDLKGTDFTSEVTAPPTIFQRMRNLLNPNPLYHAVADPLRATIARDVAIPIGFLPGQVGPRPGQPGPRPPDQPPGRIASGVAEAIVPQDPVTAIMQYVGLPLIGKLGEGIPTTIPLLKGIEESIAKSTGGSRFLKGAALRTGVAGAAGAGLGAITGEDPKKAGLRAAGTSLLSEPFQYFRQPGGRMSLRGLVRMRNELGPKYTNAILSDAPQLAPHILVYEDLNKLKSKTFVHDTLGNQIYSPVRSALRVLYPPTDVVPVTAITGLPDNVKRQLSPMAKRAIETAGGMHPSEYINVLQEVKKIARSSQDTVTVDAAKRLAHDMEAEFTSHLASTNPAVARAYEQANREYRQVESLASIVRDYSEKLFPGTGTDQVGINPAEWRKVLFDKEFDNVSPDLFPNLHRAVTYDSPLMGGGAAQTTSEGVARAYIHLPGFAGGTPIFPIKPKVVTPGAAPPLTWQRSIPSAIIGGILGALRRPRPPEGGD